MAARSFSLINEYGQEYSLDDARLYGLFTEPEGLGYEYSASYINVGDAFVRTKMKAKQGTIPGTIIFGGKAPYSIYNQFSLFIRGSKTLKLLYKVPGNARAYYRDVDLVKIKKTEIEKGVLSCPVEFYCKSLFYLNTNSNFMISTVEGELRYTIQWPARYNDYSERTVILSNNGDVEAPFTLSLSGYCENPTVTLSRDENVIASVKFPVILQPEEKIIYSSLDDNMYVYKIGADGAKTNIVQLLDIAYENFFKIPVGDYNISFTSDTGAAYETSLTMYKFYRTV